MNHTLRNAMLALVAASFVAICTTYADAARYQAETKYGRAADNKIFAQILVSNMKANNPELLAMGLHAVVPGTKEQKIIACTDDSIGKPDSSGDIEVTTLGKTVIISNTLGEAKRYKILTPLKDVHGATIGMAVFSFKRDENIDMVKALAIGLAFVDQLAARIQSLPDLFQSTE